jgi:hypothetical protein
MLNALRKAVLLGVALSGLMLVGTAGTARADDGRERCGERINHEQRELDRAIARHGYYSRQADHERRELNRLRYQCGYR